MDNNLSLKEILKQYETALKSRNKDEDATFDRLSTKESIAILHEKGLYPYKKPYDKDEYEEEIELLQIELVKLQRHIIDTKQRVLIIFEGRDAAGKGGTIKRFREFLNPRHARVVALAKPTEREQSQWYFQRYIANLPSAGEVVFFDRSWYNRAGVERVMGFCDNKQLEEFYHQAPEFEHMLVQSGIKVFKFWLTISRLEQLRRFHDRMNDPLKKWKLSPMDIASLDKWDDYTEAKEEMMDHTDRHATPWQIIRTDDKKRGRLNAIRYFLSEFDYPEKDEGLVKKLDKRVLV